MIFYRTTSDPVSRVQAIEAAEDRAECRYCHDAIHHGDCCIECWRDLRELAIARDKEWWSA